MFGSRFDGAFNPSTLQEEYSLLQEYRKQGDPFGDQLFSELKENEVRTTDVVQLIHQRAKDNQPLFKSFVQNYFEVLPSWVDFKAIETGQKFFLRVGPFASYILTCASLVMSYGASNGARVLVETGRLRENVIKRIFETGVFIGQLMTVGGLSPGKQGHTAAIKIRFLHCAVRHHLEKKCPEIWNDLGVTINQEDLAGTLGIFCPAFILSLEKLGFYVSEEEKEGYHLLWRFVGYLIGIDDRLLTQNFDDGVKQAYAIFFHQWNPNEQSIQLVDKLFDACSYKPSYFFVPRPFFSSLTRYLIGDKQADSLQICKTSRLWNKSIQLFSWVVKANSWIQETFPCTKSLYAWFGRRIIIVLRKLRIEGRTLDDKLQKY